jgi:Fungal specific transcription factor domain
MNRNQTVKGKICPRSRYRWQIGANQPPHRCSSTGRKCDGYVTIDTAPGNGTTTFSVKASTPTPAKQLMAHAGSVSERRALDYFYQRTAPQLSGFFSQDFWGRLVPQLSSSEPSIRHALIAVSCFHERTEHFSGSHLISSAGSATADLVLYNQAVNSLIQRLGSDQSSTRIPLIACILFTCLEFLRGDLDAAIIHIESGVRLLKMSRDAERSHGFASGSYSVWDSQCTDAELAPIFCTLSFLASLFGRPSIQLYSSSTAEYGSLMEAGYSSIPEAKIVLFDLLNISMHFIESVGLAKRRFESGIAEVVEQIRITNLLERWKIEFEDFADSQQSTWSESDVCAANILRATFLAMKVRVAVVLEDNESAWDGYKSEYEEIVTIAEKILRDSTGPSNNSIGYFAFEPGIISPLHFVAWRCRWPIIRRKALSLLYLNPRREGLYDSRRSYNVFRRVMIVEELSLAISPGGEPPSDILPPEYARIHQVDTICEPSTAIGTPVHFMSRPYGLTGGWHIRREYIHLGSMKIHGSSEKDSPALQRSLSQSSIASER